jgi:hypothetical protein
MSDMAVRQDADLAVAVYLEPLLEGRRVLVVGRLPEAAEERITQVARSADYIHPPAERRPSEREVPELPFRDGALDVVFVQDLSQLPEPREEAVAELRRVLDRDGVLAIGAEEASSRRRRRSSPPSEQLDSLLGREFAHVRLFAQGPVYGQALEEVDGAAKEIAVDTSLVRKNRGTRWLALAADRHVKVDARLWVQLPGSTPGDDEAEDHPQVQQALLTAEQEARAAARREADALRALEAERRLRVEAERTAERAARLEERLDAAEADFDDAVARIRWLESDGAEKESVARQEHNRRFEAERQVTEAKAEVALAETKAEAARAGREAAHAEAQALAQECVEIEKRLVERAEVIQALEADAKRQETVAKDLLEELRRIEQQRVERIEHDGRVAELEIERDRAIQRALEAEVAREAAQMHVDELRAQLHARPARPSVDPALAGTVLGLQRRVSELEKELENERERAQHGQARFEQVDRELQALREDERVSRQKPARQEERYASDDVVTLREHLSSEAARGERTGLLLRIDEAERAITSLTRIPEHNGQDTVRVRELSAELTSMRLEYEERVTELEDRLRAADQRADGLERELDEADRAAEAYADEGERLEQLERDLQAMQRRLDEVEDELRAAQDDLGVARSDVENVRLEASARIELAQRKESEARSERDEARAALEEARTILAQLQAAGVHLIDA